MDTGTLIGTVQSVDTGNISVKVEKLIQQRKAGYRADINQIPSNYGTEMETVKEYNGRQL